MFTIWDGRPATLGEKGAALEQAIATADGAKIADVVWLTPEQDQILEVKKNLPLHPAPPILHGNP